MRGSDRTPALALALVQLLDDLAEGQDRQPDVVDLADEDRRADGGSSTAGRSSVIVAIVR